MLAMAGIGRVQEGNAERVEEAGRADDAVRVEVWEEVGDTGLAARDELWYWWNC